MGVRASTLTGRAVVDPRLLHLTKWKERQVDDMLIAHEHDLGGRFALGPRHAAVLLGMTDDEARPIFELMDTDHNDLVDAFELIATIVTLSGLTIRQKIDVLHALFDFSRTGELTVDELTIFFRCVSSGCSKVDGNVVAPTVAELEKTAKWCFTKADRSLSMELAKAEFDEFVFTDPRILHFLEYFSGDTRQVPLLTGAKWTDKDWRLFADAGSPLTGMPFEGASLHSKRPDECLELSPALFGGTRLGLVRPGLVQDRGLLGAVSILSTAPRLVKSLFVPTGQEDPHGRFALRFVVGGRERVVCVDDRLACSSLNRPLLARTEDPAESLWLPLLEKAFFKLRGSADAAAAASTLDCLRALTGDAWEEFAELPGDATALWDLLKAWTARGRAGLAAKPRGGRPRGCGVVAGRAYGVMKVVEAGPKRVRLVQFGRGWAGPLPGGKWNIDADAWEDETVAKECGFRAKDEAVFWLELDEVQQVFDCGWSCKLYDPEMWTTQRRAAACPDQGGGCLNQTTWVANPQFFLDLPHKTPVQLTLTQNGTHAIGLCVVRQDRGDDGAAVEKVVDVKQDRVVGLTERFRKSPAVDMYLDDLDVGAYAIIPMTLSPVAGTGGAVAVSTRARTPHTLRGEEEILARAVSDEGTSSHDTILLEAPPAPALLAGGDQEAQSVAALYGLVGDLWVEAFGLQLRRDALLGRYKKLYRAKWEQAQRRLAAG